jgi:hypothetical protein
VVTCSRQLKKKTPANYTQPELQIYVIHAG